MTEKEARTKWCPMVQVAISGSDGFETNRDIHCAGSECMWWVWDEPIKHGVPRDGKTETKTGHCGAINGT